MSAPSSSHIPLPGQVTAEHSYELLEALGALERTRGAATLDGAACEFFGPLGAAMLAASIARRVKSGGGAPVFVPPKRGEAREYLQEIDFDRFVAGRGSDAEAGPQAGTLEMRQLTALDPVYVQQLADLLSERVPGTSELASDLIARCLNELLQNVFEWAYDTPDSARLGCFVLARWFRQQENVRLAVVDAGIGIPARLRRGRVQQLHRGGDADVIVAAATREGLSSRDRGGLGLKTIREIVTQRDGHLTIISHAAKVVFKAGSRVRTTKSPAWRGTAIELDFRPNKAVPSTVERVF